MAVLLSRFSAKVGNHRKICNHGNVVNNDDDGNDGIYDDDDGEDTGGTDGG